MIRNLILFAFTILIFVVSDGCKDVEPPPPTGDCEVSDTDLSNIAYAPTAHNINVPTGFPPVVQAPGNPLTDEGIELGRKLFYDPILSVDSTMSCFSCHDISKSFTDGLAFSPGVDDIDGKRSSMALVNLGFQLGPFFWDGRSNTLEEQALIPVEDPIELHAKWEDVVCKLSNHPSYPQEFRKAFGIENSDEITKEMAAKAISQFERTIISSNSKFDRVFFTQQEFFSDEEFNGYQMFFDLASDTMRLPDAECGHCHNQPLFTINQNQFRNNGLDEAFDLNDFSDYGFGDVTGVHFDKGKFKIPTLRNIALTAPYMHDGRFETLEEVLDHYSSGGHYADNLDPLIYNIDLDSIQKSEILAFLHTLTDTTFANKEAYSNPF